MVLPLVRSFMLESLTRSRPRKRVFLFSVRAGVRMVLRRSVQARRVVGTVMVLFTVLGLSFLAGCSHPMSQPPPPLRDINAVLADHDDELLALPGVVGVYVGLLSDDTTPCLKVMVARKDASLKHRLPRTL